MQMRDNLTELIDIFVDTRQEVLEDLNKDIERIAEEE